jgi:hypothetical protein
MLRTLKRRENEMQRTKINKDIGKSIKKAIKE